MATGGRSSSRRRRGRPTEEAPAPEGFPLERELIIIARPETGLRATPEGVASIEDVDVAPLAELLAPEDVTLVPLFGVSEERLKREATSLAPTTEVEVPDLSIYYRVRAPDEQLDELAEHLLEQETVEAAYVKPAAELPEETEESVEVLNAMLPLAEEAPSATPDFTARQDYLDAAPEGIDARYAWTLPGGRGTGVRIIDIEGAWNFSHEDHSQNQGGVVGTQSTDSGWRNHGTAVVGEFGGDRNTFGITGICPDAHVRGFSIFDGDGSSGTIRRAANALRAGDIILIELHRAGPRATGVGQQGYIAIEWWPDDYAVIRYAVSRGVIVVEAAGNGAQDLDDAIYDARPAGFPTSWSNPFNTANPSSGAVIVGAGAPPPGTHGSDHGPDRSRLGFSNYGARVDAQGWGREVTTTGYGDLQGGSNENLWYTDTFSGTSSASPIVVGALGCVQGVLRAQGGTLLTPAHAINLLRTTGSPQQDAPGRPRTQRIGNRPNLSQLIPAVTNAWQYNKRVIRTHAKHNSQMAWAVIDGSSWLRVRPHSPDGVTNVFEILCEALANNRRVDVYIQDGQITQANLR